MTAFLQFDGLTKHYGAACVLDDVSLTLDQGRMHALMGENGAGKSTLIKLIAGLAPAETLSVRRSGMEVPLRSARDAARAGFRFIHQELNIVPQLSVAENILLGHAVPARLGCFVDWPELRKRAGAALTALGVSHIDPRHPAGTLSTGDRMLIKIASALVAAPGDDPPCLYVLDEPTAALQDSEVARLFAAIDRLKAQGAAILYVSHRLAEIMAQCDDVTVLRNGKHIRTARVADMTRQELVQDMTGKEGGRDFPPRRHPMAPEVICRLKSVATRHLSGIDFALHKGEILGVAGLAGAGQDALLRMFLGLDRVILGQAQFDGATLPKSPSHAWARKVAYVPAERRSDGLMMAMGVRANSILPHLRGLRARTHAERERTRTLADLVQLTYAGPDQAVWQLSGGNQQKVVFARALAGHPKLLLLGEPTRGVDVGARYEIYDLVRKLSAQGCAVIMTSSDLPELLAMSDRILTLSRGRQTNVLPAEGLTSGDLLATLYHHEPSEETA